VRDRKFVRTSACAALPFALAMIGACSTTPKPAEPTTPQNATTVTMQQEPAREPPPQSTPARDIAFPPIHHETLGNGLTIDVVSHKQLPIVSMQLVIQSGSASDPANLPGLASSVADMLREGTTKKKGAQFAEAVEFLGANLHTSAGQETLRIQMSALSEHFDAALALLAEAALLPAFDASELEKLKKRTLDDLKLKKDRPVWLARRELHKALYGEHPYARIDTTETAVKQLKRADLARFHTTNFAPNNAFLVVVGDVDQERVKAATQKLFGAWKKRDVPEPSYAAAPAHPARNIIVVDRPASVQSQIVIGNLALKRNDPQYIPLLVANQVLGGSAASRLFMDLREKRSLTYGAYSRLDETVDVGSFRASAAVRTEVTEPAMSAFFEHLDRIVKSPPPDEELQSAHRYLADSFPLAIETADRIAELVADLRVYGLPDDYWDGFRSSIRKVDAQQAFEAAKRFIHPESAVVVVVGRAADVAPALAKLGPVQVVDVDGKPLTGATRGAAANAPGAPIPPGAMRHPVPAAAPATQPAPTAQPAAPANQTAPAAQPARTDAPAIAAPVPSGVVVVPAQPSSPAQPGRPAQPGQPAQPSQPGQPAQPPQAGQPAQPPQAGQPTQPPQAGQPTQPPQPPAAGQPTLPTQPRQPTQPTIPPSAGQPTQPPIAPTPGAPTLPGQVAPSAPGPR
jgi:zinc protease